MGESDQGDHGSTHLKSMGRAGEAKHVGRMGLHGSGQPGLAGRAIEGKHAGCGSDSTGCTFAFFGSGLARVLIHMSLSLGCYTGWTNRLGIMGLCGISERIFLKLDGNRFTCCEFDPWANIFDPLGLIFPEISVSFP
jgi:hypothetical protein